MPSDSSPRPEGADRMRRALALTAPARERYAGALGAALDQLRAWIASYGERSEDARLAESAAALGGFARGRVDATRFAALFATDERLSIEAALGLERCAATLEELLGRGDALCACEVPSGADFGAAVEGALAQVGRAFGAVRAARAARLGFWRPEHDALLRAFPFARWNAVERRLAPPLLVSVDGADLRAGALAALLDGAQKLVLVVRGPCTPAPLARLVTPGVFVQQADDADALAAFLATDAPAVAALVPPAAATFTHDPARGGAAGARLVVTRRPAEAPRGAVGGASAWQQQEELRQLDALAGAELPPAAAARANPADAIASWLLAQSGLLGEDAR